jgi:hypothetical protein
VKLTSLLIIGTEGEDPMTIRLSDAHVSEPVISDSELRARLALGEREFLAYIDRFTETLEPQPSDAAALERALSYPWERPTRSYLLRDGAVSLLDALGSAQRRAMLERFRERRTPLLAIGSNGAPDTLTRKLAHLDERDVLVIAGHLEGFDVGPSAHIAVYGSMPATLFPSPGTAVRAAILWLTPAQFTQLTRSEISYAIGRLQARFAADESELDSPGVVAFVSRFGAFAPDGEPVALAAVPARGRIAPAVTQRELLELVAARVIGAGSDAEELLRGVLERPRSLRPRAAAVTRASARPFSSPLWRPLVAGSA